MSLFQRKITTSLFLLVAFWAAPLFAEEAPSVSIEFENTPLFSEANFLPGTKIIRFVKVTNDGVTSQPISTETLNESQTDILASAIDLVIKHGATTLWSGTLDSFFNAGKINLSDVSSGQNVQYDFEATFNPEAGNDYQNATVQFDLVIGYQGGSANDTPLPPPSSGGGFGGLGGDNDGPTTTSLDGGGGTELTQLIIISQNINSANPALGTANISWTTNLFSTSQIVYGPADSLYSLDLNAPHFGYPSGTIQNDTQAVNHNQSISGLSLGTYRFRVVSRLTPTSLPTIGTEGQFTLSNPPPQFIIQEVTTPEEDGTSGTKSSEEDEVVQGDENPDNLIASASGAFNDTGENGDGLPLPGQSNLAAAFFGLPAWLQDNLDCISYAFLLLILIYAIWTLLEKRYKNELSSLGTRAVAMRKFYFFLFMSFIVFILAIIYSWCLLWPFVVLSVLYLLGLLLKIRG